MAQPGFYLAYEPEIKIQKYVYSRILSGFFKAVVDLQIVKVRVHLLPGLTRFLSGKWSQKLNIIIKS